MSNQSDDKICECFLRCLICLAGIIYNLENNFFSKNLILKTQNFVLGFISFRSKLQDMSREKAELISVVNSFLETIEFLNNSLQPMDSMRKELALLEKNMLEFKLEILRFGREYSITKKEKSAVKKEILYPNRAKILDFIKRSPKAKIEDLRKEFNSLSTRTIRRGLSELIRGGYLKKNGHNKETFYSIISSH